MQMKLIAIIAGLAANGSRRCCFYGGKCDKRTDQQAWNEVSIKGVKVDVLDGIVTVSLALNLNYGYSIKDITSKVQEKVKTAIEEYDRT